MSKKNNIFAPKIDDDYEPSALAVDRGGIPTLTGKAAERFLRMAEEAEKEARERAKKPMTEQEARNAITHNKMFMESAMSSVNYYKERIKELEEYINSLNGKEQK